MRKCLVLLFMLVVVTCSFGQSIKWAKDGNSYYVFEQSQIVQYKLPDLKPETVVSMELLIPDKKSLPVAVEDFQYGHDEE